MPGPGQDLGTACLCSAGRGSAGTVHTWLPHSVVARSHRDMGPCGGCWALSDPAPEVTSQDSCTAHCWLRMVKVGYRWWGGLFPQQESIWGGRPGVCVRGRYLTPLPTPLSKSPFFPPLKHAGSLPQGLCTCCVVSTWLALSTPTVLSSNVASLERPCLTIILITTPLQVRSTKHHPGGGPRKPHT